MRLILTVALAGLIAGAAAAQSVARTREAQDKALKDKVDQTNRTCGTEITGKLDWSKIKEKDLESNAPAEYCDGALGAIRAMCGDAAMRERLKAVKTVSCLVGEKRAAALDNGTLTFTMEWNASNNDDFVKTYLGGAL